MPRAASAVLIALAAVATPAARSAVQAAPIFRFHTDELWLNLHHFLYVLGRADAKMPDAGRAAVAGAPADSEQGLAALTAEEQRTWREAVAFYAAGPSRKDAIFDEPLSVIGFDGLEIAFHEAMHQWDPAMNGLLFGEARRTGKRLPPNVSHGLIFMTAGEAVRRVDPDHVPYADANGVWDGGYDRVKALLDEVWKPYLRGAGTRDEAIAALVSRVGS